MRKFLMAVATCSALALASAAGAQTRTGTTEVITPLNPGTGAFNVTGNPYTGTSPVTAYIGDTVALGTPDSPYTFTDIFSFIIGPDTGSVIGTGSGSLTTSTSIQFSSTDLDFLSILVNGMEATLTPNGLVETGSATGVPIVSGALNTITVTGVSRGFGSYGGNVTFLPQVARGVPEPATWAMMLIGFGGIGFSMRRRRSSARLLQAA